ncbi:hypothetical protein FOZ63_014696 [Perkinsus olseni]|uniref:Uncharacterized protein n=1 Tax=Perkinsus olseni TaxID=32597 RepID=A0A7J6SHJ5_PEROL|nr:hypothetical protein FOZ63_014696 [Perkinsus olseni]
MAFQLPHHFEALRCMALERLWDGQQGREPMHDLMGDILEYCRKPALTLGCYQEEVLIDEWPSNDFAFVDCGVMYQVSAKNGAIRLYRTCAVEDGVPETTEVSTLYSSTLYGEVCKCYHDGDTRKLYVMYRKSDSRYHTRASDCVLIKHDLPSGKTEAPIVFPNLGSSNGSLAGIIVVGGDWLYVVVEFELQNQSCDYSTEMKMFSVRLSMSSRYPEVLMLSTSSIPSPIRHGILFELA